MSLRRLTTLTGAACVLVAVLASGASSAPQAVDLEMELGAATARPAPQTRITVPNGGLVTVTSLRFWVEAGMSVSVPPAGPVRATIRVELGEGLRWGEVGPDPSEGCTSTQTTRECELTLLAGMRDGGWHWDVIADRPGTYSFRGEIAEASDVDPNASNNASAITIVVTEGGGGGGGGDGGGGSAGVSASAARVMPARPRAGRAVTASVRVSAGGAAVRPTRVACTGSIGSFRLRGTPRAGRGAASCAFRTPAAAKGKVLRGSVAFTARGQRITKRFSVRLG